jgi:autotransporter-associated beta strand protein
MSYTVAQIRAAYGINSIPDFGSAADGSGQTIGVDEVGNDPNILTDLDGFDEAMGLTTNPTPTLYQQYGPASSFVTVYNQSGVNITANIATSGSNGVPIEDPTGHWEGEETLDVEWAHAIAPGAKIDIIEVADNSDWTTNLLVGDALAASLPGVSVVSNSYGLTQWSGETAYDSSTFVTPNGHNGVTFLTASTDNGANVYPTTGGGDSYYPATSPNVVSVGGTVLTLNNDGYGSETGWSFPAPASTVNNGTSSYAQTGSWVSKSGGFSGTYSTAAGGSSSSASWTIAVTPTNTGWGTEVSATWTASPSNATNATYTIYDGTQASGTILGTVAVNQTEAPVGTADGSSQFQELGVFFPTLTDGDGTLTVVLNANSANGTVVADAVGTAQAWASTGGPALFESEPSYQLPFQSTGFRTTPDVSFDASQNSGVTCYQDGGLGYDYFGTSLGCPCWAGLIAIANQGLVAEGGTTLNSPANPTQTLQAIYSLSASDFEDISSGYNGFSAEPGYDEVTGRGSPIANLLIPDLVRLAMEPGWVNGVWAVSGGGTFIWGTGSNWQGGVAPGAAGDTDDTAVLGVAVGSGTATITLGASQTLSSLTFSPAAGGSYALSGSGGNSLQLANGGSSASISVDSGSDTINAPVILGDNVNVTAAGGASLTISGSISESGGSHGLTLSGSGSLTISGSNSYSGGTTVNGGTLIVTSAGTLPSDTSLTVGAGGTFIFDPSQSASSVLAAGLPAPASGSAVASEASTPIVAVSALSNGPVTASALSTLSAALERHLENLSYVPVTAPVAKAAPLAATPPAMSRATIDAVFASHRPAFDQTVLPADNSQSACPWAWLAAIESSWNSADQNQKTGSNVEALDKVLARFGV